MAHPFGHRKMQQPISSATSLYVGALDGVRLLAFLLVFIHHLPPLEASQVMYSVNARGFVGVDLFFILSSYLFFYLLSAEQTRTSSISIRNFYIRRFLRIYPLMTVFTVVMLVYFGPTAGDWSLATLRLAGQLGSFDNILAWRYDYDTTIRFVAHLWTLSFEFQVYALIPFAFILWHRIGTPPFLMLLASIWLICLCARLYLQAIGVGHPIIWVTPFLRPESVLLGIALFIMKPRWNWIWSLIAALLTAGVYFGFSPAPWESMSGALVAYPLMGLAGAAFIDAVLRGPLRNFFGSLVMRWLGRISFGLYVFHFLGIYVTSLLIGGRITGEQIVTSPVYYAIFFGLAFSVTVLMSALSYVLLERPVDRIKHRYSAVIGRM